MSGMFRVRNRLLFFLECSRTSLETCQDSVLSVNNGRIAAFVIRVNYFSLVLLLGLPLDSLHLRMK